MTSTSNPVIQRFIESAATHPDRAALWTREGVCSYAELSGLAAGILRHIQDAGLQDAERIGVVTGDDQRTYAAILAILANGSAYVPLNRKSPAGRNLQVIHEARPDAVLLSGADSRTDALTGQGGAGVMTMCIDAVDHTGELLTARPVDHETLAYVFFTSGSTGTPKGVPITHGSLNRFMSVMLDGDIYEFGCDDRFLQMFELTFDLSVMSFFVPLSVGACCYVVPDSRIGYVSALKVLRDQAITVALMVPSLLVYLEPYLAGLSLPELRMSLFCGEALPESVTEKWHASAPASVIENVYGPTEATIFCLRYPWFSDTSPAAAVNGVVPIGTPFPGMEVALLDRDGGLVSTRGETGELLLMGDQVTAGYWRDPAKTAEAFIEIDTCGQRRRAYRTGDLCFVDQRGDYVYRRRLDAQMKIDGHRVEPGEIEHHLRELLGRAGLAVIGVADGLRTELALFVESPGVEWTGLSARLQQRVPAYMVPKHVRTVEHLPLNLNGKVDRPALREMFTADPI